MKCEECRVLLSALLDGELSEHERVAVTAHLSECEACRDLFNDLCASHELLASMGEENVPEGFSTRVMQRVHAQRMRRTLRRVSSLAACLAVMLIVGVAVYSTGMNQSAAPDTAGNLTAPEMSIIQNDVAADCETPMTSETYGAALGTADDQERSNVTSVPDMSEPDAAPSLTLDPVPAESNEPAGKELTSPETPQPVFRLMNTPAAERFLQQNALPDTLDETGACVSVDALRELPEEIEPAEEENALLDEVLANWAGESTVRVELVPLTEETE